MTTTSRPFLRELHIYLSFFIAPCLIFFAVTGAFQTFRVPDRADAPVLLQKMARVHRDSVFALKPPTPPKPDSEKAAAPKKPKPAPSLSFQLVRWFFVLAAAAIVLTTLIGLWMGLAYSRNRGVLWLLLLAGSAIPVSLLAL